MRPALRHCDETNARIGEGADVREHVERGMTEPVEFPEELSRPELH